MTNNEYSLNESKVKSALKTEYIGKDIYFFEKTTSTFDEAESLDIKNGTVIYARCQTSGRGRLGRQWQSKNGGIYFSVILKPQLDIEKVQIMTSLCAVGIQRAIARFIPCKIKWPNDIISSDGKKLCGILTKIQHTGENDCYINVGIGINANTECFDAELKYASSIKLLANSYIDESELLCRCLEEIEKATDTSNMVSAMDYYKKVCVTLNSRVKILYATGKKSYTGICTDIQDDGTLVIKKDDGDTETVNSGEVSVRGIYGEEYV